MRIKNQRRAENASIVANMVTVAKKNARGAAVNENASSPARFVVGKRGAV